MSRNTALYASLTRKGRALLNQMQDLFDLACQSGCEIMATLSDDGAIRVPVQRNGRDIAKELAGVARHDVGVVLAWTVDRSGRERQHLVITPVRNRNVSY